MTTPPLADASVAPKTPVLSPLAAPEPAAAVNTPVEADLPPPLPQLAAGELPAVLVPPITPETEGDPTVQAVISNFGELGKLGIEYYEAADQSTVLYNPKVITEDQLKEAEANGTLAQIAPPIGGSMEPQAQGAPLAQTAPAGAPAAPPRLTNARIQNFNPRPVSPIQPNPITQQLDKRAL